MEKKGGVHQQKQWLELKEVQKKKEGKKINTSKFGRQVPPTGRAEWGGGTEKKRFAKKGNAGGGPPGPGGNKRDHLIRSLKIKKKKWGWGGGKNPKTAQFKTKTSRGDLKQKKQRGRKENRSWWGFIGWGCRRGAGNNRKPKKGRNAAGTQEKKGAEKKEDWA